MSASYVRRSDDVTSGFCCGFTCPFGPIAISVFPRRLNSTNVLRQSKALQVSGLQADGYDHVNIDSFWAFSPTQIVDKYGRWTTNLTRFPDGMAVVSDTVHDRGQKLGLYVNPGVAVAAVKAKSPVEGTGCTADDIVMKPSVLLCCHALTSGCPP